ncbi:MAG: hypothetical protein KKG99_02165 [Bacteroidetes bacterium]|nr:hypothetical protein [Bacteroidota bacterium]
MKTKFTLIFGAILLFCFNVLAQSYIDWQKDIDILIEKIDKYHPRPWTQIFRNDFLKQANIIKSNQKRWDNDRITLELMKLVALLKDGHSQIWLNNQDNFNLWYPVRIENFSDGMYVTGVSEKYKDLLYCKVIDFDGKNCEEVYRAVGSILAVDHEVGISQHITNYLSNATVLNLLGIVKTRHKMSLNVKFPDGRIDKLVIEASEWTGLFNWAWVPSQVPTNDKTVTMYTNHLDSLPLFLQGIVDRERDYWYRLSDDNKYLYFQFGNCTAESGDESFSDFTKRMFDEYDKNSKSIEKFIVDVRYNEGGDGSIVNELVKEFIKRKNNLSRGKLFIITGKYTFSTATNFIGQMLEYTQAITVGDIASGGLNWCSDTYKFVLPNSQLIVDISTMYWQKGFANDTRGYYPPDYYIPVKSTYYFAFKDITLEAILGNRVAPLKEILLNEGSERFLNELKSRKNSFRLNKYWFPYTSFDLTLFAFQKLLSTGKVDEALTISKLNMELYPEEITPYYISAMVYDELGKYKEALDCFDKLVNIEANHAEANWDRERIYALVHPIVLQSELVEKYKGNFEGDRKIIDEEGNLYYQLGSGQKRKLIPLSSTSFLIDGINQHIEIKMNCEKPEAIVLTRYSGQRSKFKTIN